MRGVFFSLCFVFETLFVREWEGAECVSGDIWTKTAKGIGETWTPDLDPERTDKLGNADIDNIEFGRFHEGKACREGLSSGTEFCMDGAAVERLTRDSGSVPLRLTCVDRDPRRRRHRTACAGHAPADKRRQNINTYIGFPSASGLVAIARCSNSVAHAAGRRTDRCRGQRHDMREKSWVLVLTNF
jgi:hypothetical protein